VDRGQGELRDRTRPEHQAVGRSSVLEVPELLALRDVVSGVSLASIMHDETSDMPTGTKAMRIRAAT
jgi:hypothetical protein